MRLLRLQTFAPDHPAAALIQGRMTDGVHPRCHVYAPLGAGLLAHLDRLAASNARPAAPTAWAVDARAGAGWLERGLREQPGNAAVVTGPAVGKLGRMRACVEAGLHVLADAPWVADPAALSGLDELFHQAELRELVVWPLMPERHDPAMGLLRELAADPDVFGGFLAGTADDPTVLLDATRHLAEAPAWGFDPAAAGDALAAAGPLADLALRLLVPDRPPDPARDLGAVDGTGWPGLIDRDRFAAVTGLADFPPALAARAGGGTLAFPANGTATFTLNGVAVRLSVLTECDPAPGGDTLEAVAKGARATLAARGGAGPGELTVTPQAAHAAAVFPALIRRCQALQDRFPGLSVQDLGGRFRLGLPAGGDPYAAVLAEFVRHFRSPRQVPAWERAAAVAGHHLTTAASQSARLKQVP